MKIPPHFRRALAMFRPYKTRLALAFLGMILTASTEPMFPAVMRVLLDRGFVGKPTLQLWMVPVAVVGIFVLRGISTFLTSYMMTWVTTMLLNAIRAQMFARVLDVPASFYASSSVGKVINGMMFEAQQVIDMVRNVLTSLIRDSLTVIVLLAFLIWLNWRLTIVALVLLPLTAVVVRLTGKRVRKLTREYLEINAELTQVIEETTRANQVIKIFGGQKYENDRFEARAAKLRRYSMRMASTLAATVPITQIMAACAVATVIVIALIQSSRGQSTVGDFVSFITAMLMLLTPLKRLAEVSGPLQRGLAASEAVFGLIDAKPERTTGETLPQRAQGRLEFADVSFTYPGQAQRALSGINLSIMPGETVAFVGMSGGGKTTLVSLVPNFFSASSGEIRLDGRNIEEIALPSLRAQIAMVSQSVVLFDDTVAANIAYGDPSPDIARVQAAVRAAYLSDVVAQLPAGLDTVIGDNGNRLSGGQRQRMAIARAIYKDAPILILDEATSALDTESERAVQAALETLMQGRTTLVIAHRLSTIERADRIVVLVGGQVVEVGSHEQLLERDGTYASLYHLQFAKDIAA
ncbi:lipid A export permease/ATP-binding protein MsbA [Noviherbaspirillum suwonense]|uniref:ATP-binding cassette, subfamily B, MsbA n=1 Tax=Noviherbaspirillum suwonense TaxID=1224511 RepID=A0ABY1Q5Z8_9BURK|nr:lipid A export permease/ATP-binding protein MsbA [Noviherbaspirillum suwonense]SMP59214.1 ATP-binding cassette, subfamily B, MsbA [Noviherbaspirillum suwonense]